MLNLELLINFSHEFLMDQSLESIHEGIYQVVFESSDKFLHSIKLEYETIFASLSIDKQEIQTIMDIDTKLDNYSLQQEKAISKNSGKIRNDVFDSITMDDGGGFCEYSLKDAVALVFDIELQWKEYYENCYFREKALVKGLNDDPDRSNSLDDSSMDQKVASYREKRYFSSFGQQNGKKKSDKFNSPSSVQDASTGPDGGRGHSFY